MKPISAKIFEHQNSHTLFILREVNLPYFSTDFHFHQECQMVYIVESEGKRIIGDSVEHFESNELVFLGSNTPHVWHNDQQYFKQVEPLNARSIALYFNPSELSQHLSAFGDIKKLISMLTMAERGMKFYGVTKSKLAELLVIMLQQKGLPLIINLLRILDIMMNTTEYELLASAGYTNNYQSKDNERMDRVFKYVFNNFKDEIPLSAIATIAGMNVQAFCRYFKSRTQKSFTQFVNEIRIGHACKLLSNPQETVIQIAFSCGFNTISNFNRFFKEIKGITPREYRKQLLL